MLAKLTSKNQITIPKAILSQVPDATHFDVPLRDGNIILKPVRVSDIDLDGVRQKMKSLGLHEDSVAEAVRWARER
jgi:bifunctional DNA-binding transcriptional regulator/antitoxin component of YhaV-PrlF toxin-antitoxin module